MFKAVIFDLGNVVLEQHGLNEHLMKSLGCSDKRAFMHALNTHSTAFCRGEISDEEYWKLVLEELSLPIPDLDLNKIWMEVYEEETSVDQGVKVIIDSLKGKYKLGLLTNTIQSHSDVNEKRGVYDIFDAVHLSQVEHLTKENPDFFLSLAKKLGVNPEECIFIDDHQEWVDMSDSLGMKGVLFSNADQLRTDLTFLLG